MSKRIPRLCLPPQNSGERILGIDPSLSSSGFSYRYNGDLYTGRINPKKLKGPERLVYQRRQLEKVLDAAQPTIVVYEDYAMGARGNNAFHLGELGGVFKSMLWERGIDVLLVSPTGLKKCITGKGNADKGKPDKPEMRAALLEKFGYDIGQNDEADAFGLMLLGEIRFGVGPLPVGVRKQLRIDTLDEYPLVKGKGREFLKLIANKT